MIPVSFAEKKIKSSKIHYGTCIYGWKIKTNVEQRAKKKKKIVSGDLFVDPIRLVSIIR